MIQSLLIANRGEIACRVMRTAQPMGIRTVAVYSDADAKALHVRQADDAVHIGASPAAESYLVGAKIIAAARETGAEAIHPGYGFLSENADFAQDVIDAGLIWVGPKPDSIRAMGLKDAAKTLMADAGVPVTPGYIGDNQDPDLLAEQAEQIGYPVLIKAVAGGGGKGMRKVDGAVDFADSLISCQREAKASFGNDIVLIEKWIESPRHIEVQVFGDSHGNVVHLFERDCSLQRRHQKVIEEAPAPGMDETTREELCAAAVRAAKAVNYENAGTIEFIADASNGLRADKIWFMEMNTRLQVEHPVTEEITGVDLVEWQLRVAGGEAIPLKQEELSISGHAIEARLYAEDPARGFLPSTGKLEVVDRDEYRHRFIRVDAGVEEGDIVTPHYDPMLAKYIAKGENRTEAIGILKSALGVTQVAPVKTNTGFLYRIAGHEDYVRYNLDTGWIDQNLDSLLVSKELAQALLDDAATVLVGREIVGFFGSSFQLDYARKNHCGSVWKECDGFRLNKTPSSSIFIRVGGETIRRELPIDFEYRKVVNDEGSNPLYVFRQGEYLEVFTRWDGSGAASASDGAILAPMPGRVISVDVVEGDAVSKGQKLLTLEAMKMEHTLTAPFDGVVAELNAEEGAQVEVDAVLAVVESSE